MASSQYESQKIPLSPLEAGEFDAMLKRGLNLRPIFRSFKRNLILILGITAALGGYTLYKAAQAPPTYAGRFQLLTGPVSTQGQISDPLALTRSGEREIPGDVSGIDFPTQLQVLLSPALLDEVVEDVRAEFPGFSLKALNKGLLVERVGETRFTQTKIINVTYSGTNPELVESVLEATARRYLKYSLEDRRTRFSEGIKFIEDQLPRVQERVNLLETQLQTLQQQYDLVSPELQSEQLSSRIFQMDDLYLQTQRELAERQAIYTKLQQQLQLDPNQAVAASALSQDPRYQTLLNELQLVEQQIAEQSVQFTDESRVIQSLQQRRENLGALLNQEAERILAGSFEGVANNPQVFAFQDPTKIGLIQQLIETANQIESLQSRNQVIERDRAAVAAQLEQFPVLSRRYSEIDRQLDIALRSLDQLLGQRELLKIESAQTEVPWELVSEPGISRDASGEAIPVPQSNKALIAALGAAVILGVGAALLIDKLRGVFFTTEDIQDAIEIPVIGIIPFCEPVRQSPVLSLSDNYVGESAGDMWSRQDPRTLLFSEAFSSLYAGIQFANRKHGIRSVVIMSAEPGDGKTTVALNLAQTIAGTGKRTLLVDANLYNPELHNQLGLINQKGLKDILTDNLDFKDLIQPTLYNDNLSVLVAGEPTSGSSRFIASPRMQSFMQEAHEQFEFVIYDVPQSLGLTDARFLASNVDASLVVISLLKTKRSNVMQVLNDLVTYQLPVLGVVANHPKPKSKVSYGYQSTHYQRQPDQEIDIVTTSNHPAPPVKPMA